MSQATQEFSRLAVRTHSVSAYVDLCERFVRETPPRNAVVIDQTALSTFAISITAPTGPAFGWNDYISSDANAAPLYLAKVFHEMAAITGQLGGYFERSREGVRKWEVDGSGAKATVLKMAEIRDEIGVPGEMQNAFRGITMHKLGRAFAGVPYKTWRVEALEEMMGYGALRETGKLLRDYTQPRTTGQQPTVTLDFTMAQQLADMFPYSFGNDPFFKKASLTLLLVDAHVAARRQAGEAVPDIKVESIAAADYRLPQALSAEGVGILKLSPRLRAKLEEKRLLAEQDEDVFKLRAASIVAAHKLCLQSQQPMSVVDAALWRAGRNLEKQGKTLPPMQVLTTHF
jgi:hypothetical protein